MTYAAEELWAQTWPDVPWAEASEDDKQLFRDHADSINFYHAFLPRQDD
jgi:hypothetical protein